VFTRSSRCPIRADFVVKSNFIVLTSFIIMLIAFIYRNNENFELFDKIIYLAHFLLILIFFLKNFDKYKVINIVLSISAIAVLLFGVITTDVYEQWGIELVQLWSGFGISVFIVMVILIFGFFSIKKFRLLNLFLNSPILKILTVFVLTVIYGLSLWQTKNSIIDFGHTKYILNESLALSASRIPYSNFIPQYSISYNVFTFIASKFMNIDKQLELLMFTLFMVSILAIALAIRIAGTAFKTNKIFLPFLLIVPLTLLTPGLTRESTFGSIASLFSGIPVRLFPVIILFLVYFTLILKNTNSKNYAIRSILVGIYGGLVIWNSPDFGLVGVASLYISMLLTKLFSKTVKIFQTVYLSTGVLIGISLYPALLTFFGYKINVDFLAFFTRQFGSGFSSQPINPVGPILVIFPLLFILFSFHFFAGFNAKQSEKTLLINSFTGVFFSIFCILSFPYYVNRSIVSGQLQLYLLPISISLAIMIGILIKNDFFSELRNSFRGKNYYSTLINLPLIIFCFIPISTLILFPNPKIELARIYSDKNFSDLVFPPETLRKWPPGYISITMDNIDLAKSFAKNSSKNVSYFGSMSNYISVKKDIRSVNIFNSPDDFLISDSSLKIGCDFLTSKNFDFLILDHDASDAVKRYMDIKKKSIFCDEYIFSDKLNIEPYFFLERFK
jgi:hypothetical protein